MTAVVDGPVDAAEEWAEWPTQRREPWAGTPPLVWYGLPGKPAHLPDWLARRGHAAIAWTTRCGHRITAMDAVARAPGRCLVCVRSAVASGLLSQHTVGLLGLDNDNPGRGMIDRVNVRRSP